MIISDLGNSAVRLCLFLLLLLAVRFLVFTRKLLCEHCKQSITEKMFHISHDFFVIVLAGLRNCCTFASHLRGMPAEKQKNAAIAQLVERNLAKVEVAGPSPVCRSLF